MSNVKIFKLITGEEVVGNVVSDDSETNFSYTVKDTVLLILQQTQQGFGVSLVPWAHGVENGIVTLQVEHTMYVATPKKELLEMYEKAFSPITLPTKSLITG